MATRLFDKDLEVRRGFDEEIRNSGVELTTRSNPLKQVESSDGDIYLCDSDVDESGDLLSQGCMNYDEIAVTRHG